jgi:sugar phosphate isomerase/epimerase
MDFTRRTLFHSAAVAATGSALAGGGAHAGSKSPGLKIGIASYSLKAQTLDQVIEFCKANDVKYITLKDLHLPRNAPAAQLEADVAKITAAGITITGGGVIKMKNDPPQVRKEFEYARTAKLPMIVAAPEPDALDVVEAMVKEFSILVAIHNHGPEDSHFPSPREVMAAIKKRDKRIGVCMDIGHAFRAGVDPVASVAECGPRLMDLHIKDITDKAGKTRVAVGRGAIDVVGVIKALHKRRFQGHVALEYELPEKDPVPGMRESLGFMRGVAAALA